MTRATRVARGDAALLASRVVHRWRRSLQLRVVATTLVVSGLVVLLLASLLLNQIGRGLVQAKTRDALTEARSGLAQAQEAVEVGGSSQSAVEDRLQDVARVLSIRGQSGTPYTILLVSSLGDAKAFASPGRTPSSVPADLQRTVEENGVTAYRFLSASSTLAIGGTVTAPREPYQLYFFFSLSAENRTLGLVRRTATIAGLLLVLLLALIAALVARQVVLPVRMAARTAGRLAKGLLEERMVVRGEDDIAQLAESFNSMAVALQTQIRQLEDLSRVQRRFVSDVTHELRTPLTTVRMAADVLYESRAGFPSETGRSAELLQTELERFEELLAELLEISRYDAGAASLDAERLDLVPLVSSLIDRASSLAESKGSRVTLEAEGPVIAEVDHVRIERVVRNLLNNALEHGEGRPVEISVAKGEDCAAIRVRDHGVGLKRGEAGLVFTRFWRGDPSRTRATGGTGLGLAIALEDARLHGGTLQAWGEPGKGAVFLLTVPLSVGARMSAVPLALDPRAVLL
ncbi:MAG: periplasmic sensor signal transduction histidine kinase [Frankiales bacterium]|nr:periplasmic sensor signal transduction histidine kinase [Frankiales bacterium]